MVREATSRPRWNPRMALLATGLAVGLLAGGGTSWTASSLDYDLTYAGMFRNLPADQPTLEFLGRGGGAPLGPGMVAGGLTAPGEVPCDPYSSANATAIATLGSLIFVLGGGDCLDPLSSPGQILVHGEGPTRIVGGTGGYEGASGVGAWTVEAVWRTYGIVQDPAPRLEIAGTFELRFTGTLELP